MTLNWGWGLFLSLAGLPFLCAIINKNGSEQGGEKKVPSDSAKFPLPDFVPSEFVQADMDQCFRSMMENSLFLIYFKAADNESDFRYIFANQRWKEAFGGDMLGKSDFEIQPREIAEQMRQQDEIVLHSELGTVHVFDIPFYDKMGQRHWGKTHKLHLRLSSGRDIIFGHCIDQTEEWELRSQIEVRRELLRCILDHIPASIAVKNVDSGYRYVVWNKECERETGIPQEKVIGETDREIVPEPWSGCAELARSFDEEVMRKGETRHEQWYTMANGQRVYLRTRKRRLTMKGKDYIIDMSLNSTREREAECRNKEVIAYQRDLIRKSCLYGECLTYIAKEPRYEKAVRYILRRFGEEMDADRSYIYRYRGDEFSALDCLYEWTSGGTDSVINRQQGIDAEQFPEIWRHLEDHRELAVDAVDDLESEEMKSRLRAMSVRSLILFPLYDGSRLRGFTGLNYVRRQHFFSESDIRAVGILASLIEIAFFRKKQVDQIINGGEFQQQYIRNVAVMKILYNSLGEIEKVNPHTRKIFPQTDQEILGHPCEGRFCHGSFSPDTCPVCRAFADARPHRVRLTGKDGRFTLFSAMPLCGSEGKVHFVVETIDDLTEVEEYRGWDDD